MEVIFPFEIKELRMMEKRVLLVEDSHDLGELYSIALTKHGYNVKVAASAEEAMCICQTEDYPVVFLDLKLPGMNGVDLCKQLKDCSPMVIPFAVTGYASVFELFKCREAGFEDYFTKPVKLNLLAQAADQAFTRLERWKQRQQ
jgi:DNA-binding response OmpR family regulator